MKVAFIDPIVSPANLAESLQKNGMEGVAVFTLKDLSPDQKKLRFRPDLFSDHLFIEQESAAEISDLLKQRDVQLVLCGYEGSLHLTDQIAEILCPEFANDTATSEQRANKYLMQLALKEHSLPDVKQIYLCNKTVSSEARVALQQFDFPVILKPVNGESSIGVAQCSNIQDIEDHLALAYHKKMNQADMSNYIVQEYLEGVEYLVDSFSVGGVHHISCVQYYGKSYFNGAPIYRFVDGVGQGCPEWEICSSFVKKVLTAIGLNYGFAHTEMFLTPKGPRLIEVNPRVSGGAGFISKLSRAISGVDQIDVMAKAMGIGWRKDEQLKQYSCGRIALLQSWKEKIMDEPNINAFQSLESYQSHLFTKEVGTLLGQPTSLNDTVAFVLLVNQDKVQLLKDYDQLVIWESEGRLF